MLARPPHPLQGLAKLPPKLVDFLALVAGAISTLALAPFNIWPLGIVAILLLLACLQVGQAIEHLGRQLFRFYLYFVGMLGSGASWIYVSIHEFGHASPLLAGFLVVLFVTALSLPLLAPAYLFLRFFNQRWWILGFVAFWVLREWMLTWFLTGFPWLFVGYAHLDTPLAGYAPHFGVLGVSFMLVLSACLIFEMLRSWTLSPIAAVVLIWLAGFGLSKISWAEPEGPGIRVSLVQGNIDQRTKWQRQMVWPILQVYRGLSQSEWGRDIVIWPEAALTVFKRQGGAILAELSNQAEHAGSTLILGIPDQNAQGGLQNTALALGRGSGQYFKRHLVPFGEYVPLEKVLRGLIEFFDLPMSRNEPGPREQLLLRAGQLNLSVAICYEIVFPGLVRDTVTAPDFLLTISNDSWFGGSIGPHQHMQMAQMRALENARYLLRATNNGVTGIVAPNGELVQQLPQFEAGVLRGKVQKMVGSTPYSRWGEVPILALSALMLMVSVYLDKRLNRSVVP